MPCTLDGTLHHYHGGVAKNDSRGGSFRHQRKLACTGSAFRNDDFRRSAFFCQGIYRIDLLSCLNRDNIQSWSGRFDACDHGRATKTRLDKVSLPETLSELLGTLYSSDNTQV